MSECRKTLIKKAMFGMNKNLGGKMAKKEEMITVFVAGAVSPVHPSKHPQVEFLDNVREGISVCVDLILRGYAPLCTFFDFLYWFVLRGDQELTVDVIHDVSTALMKRCHVVYVKPNSEKSFGAKREVREAKRLGKPVFRSIEDLDAYRQKFFGRRRK